MNELMFSVRSRRRLTGRTGFDMSHIARSTHVPTAQVGTTNSSTNNNGMRIS